MNIWVVFVNSNEFPIGSGYTGLQILPCSWISHLILRLIYFEAVVSERRAGAAAPSAAVPVAKGAKGAP